MSKELFETKRLVLRKWRLEDANEMYKYAKDPEVGPICGWPTHTSVEQSKKIIKHFIEDCPYCYAIILKETSEPIGCIELMCAPNNMSFKEQEMELGYWLGKPHWGNGYVPEAAAALISYAFEDLGCETIWCGYFDGNNKSKRVQEKLGFVYSNTNDHYAVKLLNEVRTLHTSKLTKEHWKEVSQAKRK